MRDQLPKKPNRVETDIIYLDGRSGPGTQWIANAVDPHSVIYFDSYGLAPPREFLQYISDYLVGCEAVQSGIQHYQTQTITDPPIFGLKVLAHLTPCQGHQRRRIKTFTNTYADGIVLNRLMVYNGRYSRTIC